MIKLIHFTGILLIFIANMIKTLSHMLRFMVLMLIIFTIIMGTFISSIDTFNYIPTIYFESQLWSIIIMIIGWSTIIYGVVNLFKDEKK